MEIYQPDPHPGRCRNHRDGERCLDYEAMTHVCSFPPPMNPVVHVVSYSGTTTAPTPWVKPPVDPPLRNPQAEAAATPIADPIDPT